MYLMTLMDNEEPGHSVSSVDEKSNGSTFRVESVDLSKFICYISNSSRGFTAFTVKKNDMRTPAQTCEMTQWLA